MTDLAAPAGSPPTGPPIAKQVPVERVRHGDTVVDPYTWLQVKDDPEVLAHLEGCTIEDGSLVGSGSVVLHRAVVRSGSLVGANAVVPNDMEVPSGAMALGIPAKLREGAVQPGSFEGAAELYVANGRRYRDTLRRLD